jgi:hypothetical protein
MEGSMRRSVHLVLLLLSATVPLARAQDTTRVGEKKQAPELSEPVTLKSQFPVPQCGGGYWLQVVNQTGFPLQASLGKVRLGTAAPDERAWSFRVPSELINDVTVKGITFRSVGGPVPPQALLWDQFRVLCGR